MISNDISLSLLVKINCLWSLCVTWGHNHYSHQRLGRGIWGPFRLIVWWLFVKAQEVPWKETASVLNQLEPSIKNIYLNLVIYNDLHILMLFSIGRDIFLNQSTEDLLFIYLFNTHFSSAGFFLKAYIDHCLSNYTSQVSHSSGTYKMHHWYEQVTNTVSKLHHLNPSTKPWMSHWALIFPASLENGFFLCSGLSGTFSQASFCLAQKGNLRAQLFYPTKTSADPPGSSLN